MANPKRDREPQQHRSDSAFVNEAGELCIGGECFTLAVGDRNEVRVEVKEEHCSEKELEAIRRIKDRVVSGAPTVYRFGKRDDG